MFRCLYLLSYNTFQFIGFGYIFFNILVTFLKNGVSSFNSTFQNIGSIFIFFQALQFVETLHPILRMTKGHPLPSLIQVGMRNLILNNIIASNPSFHSNHLVTYLFFVWSLIELFRYPYYCTNLLNLKIKWLTFIRYTIWISLYPLGITLEAFICYSNLNFLETSQKYSFLLPNPANISFYPPYLIKFYLYFLIWIGTYFLLSYMYSQMKKVLKFQDKQ